MKIKRCKRCKRPVRQTVGNSGYCKKCIALARPIPDFDKLLDQHPAIPMWMNTDLNLDEYLALCEKIKADHKTKLALKELGNEV